MTSDRLLRGFVDDNENAIDWTDEFNVFSNGKTTECPCGQGIGVEHDDAIVDCATCERQLVDMDYEFRADEARRQVRKRERKAEVDNEQQTQTTLGDW